MAKPFDPNNLPKAFPKDGLHIQHGKPYITHVGLVWLANHRGKPWNGTIVSHEIKWNQSGHPHAAVVVFKVWDDEQEHTDIGDACAINVGKMIAPHLIRMASTRAQNRALRAFVRYAGCTADELEIGESYNSSEASVEAPAQNSKREEPRPAKASQNQQSPTYNIRTNCEHKCPACGGALWDNREKAIAARKNGKKMPYYSCSRKSACPGGKGDFGWGEWDDPNRFESLAFEQGFIEDTAASLSMDGPPPHDDADIPF